MGNPYSNILVPFDGSEGSVRALKEAENIAKLSEAQLTVIHVEDCKSSYEVSNAPLYGVTAPAPVAGMLNLDSHRNPIPVENNLHEHDQIPNKIITIAKAKLSGSLIDVETKILLGKPEKEICRFAEQNEVDIIVIGHRGRSGMKKLVMGNVSNKVVNQVKCPVLVAK